MGTASRAQLVAAGTDERALVAALRAGDEAVFAALVDRYSASMIRVAQGYVRSRAVAEEVVQEAWLGVLKGLDRFEGRAALKTWIFRILVNTAKTRGQRGARSRLATEARSNPAGTWAGTPQPCPGRQPALRR